MKRFVICRVELPSGDLSYRALEAGSQPGGAAALTSIVHRVATLDERQLRRLKASIDSALEMAEAEE